MNTKTIIIGSIAIATVATSAWARPQGQHRGERPNPEDLVIEIVADYDENADNAINAAELESALIGMHEKRVSKMKEMAEERGFDGKRPRRGGPDGDRVAPDTSEIASRLLNNFDEDGDSILNTEELMGAVQAIHSRGPGKRGPRGPRGHRGDRPFSGGTEE